MFDFLFYCFSLWFCCIRSQSVILFLFFNLFGDILTEFRVLESILPHILFDHWEWYICYLDTFHKPCFKLHVLLLQSLFCMVVHLAIPCCFVKFWSYYKFNLNFICLQVETSLSLMFLIIKGLFFYNVQVYWDDFFGAILDNICSWGL